MRLFPLLSLFSLAFGSLLSPASAAETPSSGRDIHVQPAMGDDANDGVIKPVKTIARGVHLAQPGDTVHLTPGTYHESIDLSLKRGQVERPIIVDGHGSVLDGSEPVRASEWESLGQGRYRKAKLMPNMNAAVAGRWFFLWNGKMNRMGRTSKAPGPPLKNPTDLQVDEWTYAKEEDAFYIRIPESQSLEAANIRYPRRSNGVSFGGKGENLVVRNVTSTHVYNDGFNVHGAQRGLVFENIAALECGDDGFSAHEDAECTINGFTSVGNSTGLCDIGLSVTHYKNVFIKDCHAYDLFFIGLNHSLENAVVESSAVYAFAFDGGHLPGTQTAQLRMKNVLLQRVGGGVQEMRIGARGRIEIENCSIMGLNVTVGTGGDVTMQKSVIGGVPKPHLLLRANTKWNGSGNCYDLASLNVDKASFTTATFGDFKTLTASDTDSRWESPSTTLPGVGVSAGLAASLGLPSKSTSSDASKAQ